MDEDQRNYLNCYGTLFAPSYEEGRLIVHSWELEYRKTVVIQGGQQFATTWDDSAVGVVARDDLSRADMGEWCAEKFELAWRRAIQPSPSVSS